MLSGKMFCDGTGCSQINLPRWILLAAWVSEQSSSFSVVLHARLDADFFAEQCMESCLWGQTIWCSNFMVLIKWQRFPFLCPIKLNYAHDALRLFISHKRDFFHTVSFKISFRILFYVLVWKKRGKNCLCLLYSMHDFSYFVLIFITKWSFSGDTLKKEII